MNNGLKGKETTGLVMLTKNGKVIRTKSFGSKAIRKIIVLSWLPLVNYIDEFQLIIRLNEQQ
jgi:hypothetical protein